MTYTPNCIKCGVKYDSDEEDAYYCPPCLKTHKENAKKIDAEIASRPKTKKPPSMLKRYDALVAQNGGRFPNINQLG